LQETLFHFYDRIAKGNVDAQGYDELGDSNVLNENGLYDDAIGGKVNFATATLLRHYANRVYKNN